MVLAYLVSDSPYETHPFVIGKVYLNSIDMVEIEKVWYSPVNFNVNNWALFLATDFTNPIVVYHNGKYSFISSTVKNREGYLPKKTKKKTTVKRK